MQATVPEGKRGGEEMQVHTQSGQVLDVFIPLGLLAGQTFQFDLPGSAQPLSSASAEPHSGAGTAGEREAGEAQSQGKDMRAYLQAHPLDVGDKASEAAMQRSAQALEDAKHKAAQKAMATVEAEEKMKEAEEEEAKKETAEETAEVAAERKDLLETALKIVYAKEAKKAAAELQAQHLAHEQVCVCVCTRVYSTWGI